MTIEEAKILKEKAEREMCEIIANLHKSTGCKVEAVYLRTEDAFGQFIITGFEIDLKIK